MPDLTARAAALAEARCQREAEALRENLRRRKAQSRAREDDLKVPTVLRSNGYRVYFYSREPNEPPHVHVDRGEASAKVWLESISLASNAGYKAHELADLLSFVRTHRQTCMEKWHGFFASSSNR